MQYSALKVFGFAVVLGLAGDLLLRVEPWGVNALLAALALAMGFQILTRRLRLPVHGAATWLWATVPVLAGILAWRASFPLVGLTVLAVVIALVATGLAAHDRPLHRSGTWELFAEGAATAVHAALGIFRLAGESRAGMLQWAPWNTKTGAVLRGALLALPPLLVFGMLFTAADAAFAQLVTDLVDIDFERVASHVVLTGVFTWLAAGWLYWVALNDGSGLPRSDVPGLRAGTLEVGVALGLVTLLFIAFVAVQSTYLFGGEALIQATTGLTYAEYARTGFFELVVVAFLVLPMLIVAFWLVRDDTSGNGVRVVRLLSAALEILIVVIMASALFRMRLYQEAYGLTHLRFLTTAFILWLGVVFVLFSATVLRGMPRWFIAGTVTSALAAVVLLAAVNPDARIAEANVQRALQGAEFDTDYLRELSADAVPAIAAALPRLPGPARCAAAHWLLTGWGAGARADHGLDWRSWNYARATARRIVGEREDRLRTLACAPDPVEGVRLRPSAPPSAGS